MRSKLSALVTLLGALVLALALFQFGGCLQSTTQPDATNAQAADSSTPSLEQIRQSVEMTDTQASKLAPALDRWQKREGDARDLEFFAEGASILDRDQLRDLVRFVGEHRAARFERMHQQRHGDPGDCPAGTDCRMGTAMGRHAGRFGGPGIGPDFGDLDLTDAQRAALRTARQEMHIALRAAHEEFKNGNSTEEQLRAAVQAARQAFDAALQEILTPEQLAQLQQNRVERFVQMITRRIEHEEQATAHRLELLTQILDLSAEQVQAIQEIHEGLVPALRGILAGVQDGSLTLEAAHAALRTLHQETYSAIVALLTPEQVEIFEALRPHRGPFGPGGA